METKMDMVKFLELTKREKRALKEFKKKIIQKLGEEVLELKLFGSKARGDFKKDSDIDVLIVLKNFSKKRKDFIFNLANEILFNYGVDISPKIFSKKEYFYLNKLPTIFFQILKREAIPL